MRTPRKLMLLFENKPQLGSSKVCHPLFMLRDMDINLLLYFLVMLIRKSAQNGKWYISTKCTKHNLTLCFSCLIKMLMTKDICLKFILYELQHCLFMTLINIKWYSTKEIMRLCYAIKSHHIFEYITLY